MIVRDMMTADPEASLPQDTLAMAGEIMQRRNCGFVPVVNSQEAKRVVGILTDRDIALHLTRTRASADAVTVEACMSKSPVVISPEADLIEAAELMERYAVHRLPVVDQGTLVGVLSLSNIALQAKREWASTGPHQAEQQMADIIEAIAAAQTGRKAGVP